MRNFLPNVLLIRFIFKIKIGKFEWRIINFSSMQLFRTIKSDCQLFSYETWSKIDIVVFSIELVTNTYSRKSV